MHALRVLEFDAARAALADRCETPAGRAAALAITPAFDPGQVAHLVAQTREADALLATTPLSLRGIDDLTPSIQRAGKGGTLEGAALARTGHALAVMRGAKNTLEQKRESVPNLARLAEQLPKLERLETKLLASLDGDGEVKDEASPLLLDLRRKIALTAQRLHDRIHSYLSGRTRELLSDPIVTQRDGRYVIPLKAEHRGKIRGLVHDTSGSGQTIYLEPEDVVQLGNALREAQGAEREEVVRILRDLSEFVGKHASVILPGLEASATLDLILGKARHGADTGGCVPELVEGHRLELQGARHPLLDRSTAIPLSLRFGEEPGGILITGPNTGGKTVAIKTVGLAVAMAQCGMMPPADRCALGPFTQLWADIGDEQSLQQSLSTFSGHIKNISAALAGLKVGALVLLDEVGAGTDPAEGANLARALLLAFQRGGARIMASTHYGELKLFASNAPGFINAAMEFDLKSLRPTYRLLLGVPGSSHALKIAERFGVPIRVLEEAKEGLGAEELDIARMIEKLESAQKQAQRAQSEADRLASRLRRMEEEADKREREARETKDKARRQAAEALDEALRLIRLEAQDVFDQLKASGGGQAAMDRARARLKDLQTVGADFSQSLRPEPAPKAAPATPKGKLEKGMTVRVEGFDQLGTLLDEPTGAKAMVQIGALKMSVEVRKLSPAQEAKPKPRAARPNLSLNKAQTMGMELHLRHMRAEDALEQLERFLDDAVLAGLPKVRIVHGKGEGVLRKVTADYLRRHRHVKSYALADAEEGGEGVTIAVLG